METLKHVVSNDDIPYIYNAGSSVKCCHCEKLKRTYVEAVKSVPV